MKIDDLDTLDPNNPDDQEKLEALSKAIQESITPEVLESFSALSESIQPIAAKINSSLQSPKFAEAMRIIGSYQIKPSTLEAANKLYDSISNTTNSLVSAYTKLQGIDLSIKNRNTIAESFENLSEMISDHPEIIDSYLGSIDYQPIDEPGNIENREQEEPTNQQSNIVDNSKKSSNTLPDALNHGSKLLRDPNYLGEKIADLTVQIIFTIIPTIVLLIVNDQISPAMGLSMIYTLLSVFQQPNDDDKD